MGDYRRPNDFHQNITLAVSGEGIYIFKESPSLMSHHQVGRLVLHLLNLVDVDLAILLHGFLFRRLRCAFKVILHHAGLLHEQENQISRLALYQSTPGIALHAFSPGVINEHVYCPVFRIPRWSKM